MRVKRDGAANPARSRGGPLKEYELRENWQAQGAPVVGRVKARNHAAAVVKWLRANGYEARVEPNGDLVTHEDAPRLLTRRVA